MRILQRDTNQVFDNIEIFLTLEEADNLRAHVEGLIDQPEYGHIHVLGDEINGVVMKELTVAVYTKDNLNEFDDKSKKLILEDKWDTK
ncbi:hypothetical protein ACFLSV_05660 [Bacteroidota bacterium]